MDHFFKILQDSNKKKEFILVKFNFEDKTNFPKLTFSAISKVQK